ncbi:hypothetical protein DK419_08165 [Methylobacterium terrae]|uniref:Uncharacterized protein n=1 Tax=Methylobacterium terrae TaxID=2202827 RepID=A0A2U8WJK8_9HYPH|nr:hypothetical protein [Methylobacterium terrae]AWN46289.1 hypothetical protein DK419_08165 [Methylobacterium terrae]
MRALTSNGLPRLGAGAALAAALFVTAAPQAQARDNVGAAILGGAAAGVLGGVAAGAILNGAQAAPPPPPAYVVPPPRRVYVEEPETVIVRPRRGPICHFERRKVWLDDESFTYKRVEVCE